MKFWKRNRRRKVALLMQNGDVVITSAKHAQCGWMARWIRQPDQWSFLNPDGSTSGCRLVKSWSKVSGWPEEPADTEDA